jgi:peptidoglycan/LPS O-acetylase OafA/YrhL
MTDSLPPDDPLKAAWLSQSVEQTQMTAIDLAAAATRFERKVRRRNLIEYAAGAVLIPLMGAAALFGHSGWMMRTAAAMSLAGVIFVLWQLHRRGSPGRAPRAGSAESLLAFQRAELVRQRDALRSVPLWYLLPLVPGFLMVGVGRWFQDPERSRSVAEDHTVILAGMVIGLLVLVIIAMLNLLGAARLDRHIDQIDRMGRG